MPILAPAWEMQVERGPDWLLVRVGGSEADAQDTPPLFQPLWALVERHFVYRLVLQLDDLPRLTSELLDQLVLLHRRVGEHQGVLRLCGLSRQNLRVLRAHGLDTQFPCYHTLEEAVMGSSQAKPR